VRSRLTQFYIRSNDDTDEKYRQLCSRIGSNGVILHTAIGGDKNHVLSCHTQFLLFTGFNNTVISAPTLAACIDGGNKPRVQQHPAYSRYYNITNIRISGITNDAKWTICFCGTRVELEEPEQPILSDIFFASYINIASSLLGIIAAIVGTTRMTT
jgi:hypothetical protein